MTSEQQVAAMNSNPIGTEFEDCPISYIVFDRSGNIGIFEEEVYTSSIKWINDDKRYKIEIGKKQ